MKIPDSTARLLVLLLPAAASLYLMGGAPSGNVSDEARAILEERISSIAGTGPVFCRSDMLCGSSVLPEFYRARGFRPAWIDDALTLSDAGSLLPALRRLAEDGLDPGNYHLAALEALMAEIQESIKENRTIVRPGVLVDLEMLLTDAFLLAGSHLVHGQVNPETIQSEWFIKGRSEDLAGALEKGLANHDLPAALDSLRPSHAVYAGLKRAYQVYKAIAAAGGWPEWPPGPKLKKGDASPRVAELRRILGVMGDLDAPAAGPPEAFDESVEAAVKIFQRRHGLAPDGVVGKKAMAALAVPAERRATQIQANLERWRWITQDLGERYILINVADFRVIVVEQGREVLSMPAVVGTYYRQTPDFSGDMDTIEINPFWTIPAKLVFEDILPKYGKNPGYLREKGIRVFKGWSTHAPEVDPDTIEWSKFTTATLPYRFRQDPGPKNPLGRLKFMFPNKFDVYLHDTPERWIFARAARNFSSGCVRLERPLDLAEYLLKEDPDWDRKKLLAAIESRKNVVIPLEHYISVHLLYWTAWLAGDGQTHFREDIYLRDQVLYRALQQKPAEL